MPEEPEHPPAHQSKFERKHQARVRSREKRKSSRLRFYTIVGSLVLIILLAGAVVITKRHSILTRNREYRADRFLEQSLALTEDGDQDAAAEKLIEAYRLKPYDPAIIRAVAKWQEGVSPGGAGATFFYGALAEAGVANEEDRYALLQLYIRQGRNLEGEALARDALAESPDDPELLFWAAQASAGLGDTDTAVKRLVKAKELKPDDEIIRLNLALTQLQSSWTEVRDEGWKNLLELAEEDESEAGLIALRAVFLRRDRLMLPLDRFYPIFEKHPLRPRDGDPTTALLAWQLHLAPSKEEQLQRVRDALDAWAQAGLQPQDLNQRLTGLAFVGFADEVTAFYEKHPRPKLEPGALDEDVLSSELVALAGQKKFDEAEAIIEEIRASGQKALAAGCKAMLMRARGEPEDKVLDEMRHASLLAAREGSPLNLYRMGRVALLMGKPDEARHAYSLALDLDPINAHQALILVAEREGKLDEILLHQKALLDLLPDQAPLHERVAYLQLLLKDDLEQAVTTVERLRNEDPAKPEYLALDAFAHFRYNELEKAGELARQVDAAAVDSVYHPVLVAVYRAAGDQARADALAAGIDAATLNEPERALLGE